MNSYGFELYKTTSHDKNVLNRLFNSMSLFVVYKDSLSKDRRVVHGVTTSDNEWQQAMTNDNQWQRMTTSDNEWKRVVQRMKANESQWDWF